MFLAFMRRPAWILLVLVAVGCGIGERNAAMRALLATNAPRSVVESTLGCRIRMTRRESPCWVGRAPTHASSWQRVIAQKAQRAVAVGQTSTLDVQTYIFLDGLDRLIDFEVGSQ